MVYKIMVDWNTNIAAVRSNLLCLDMHASYHAPSLAPVGSADLACEAATAAAAVLK